MAKSSRGQSSANRQARQEQSQAEALEELRLQAAARHEKSDKLRKLRLEQGDTAAGRFKTWRKQDASENGV